MSVCPPRAALAVVVALLTTVSAANGQTRARSNPSMPSGYAVSSWRDSAIDHHNQVLLMRAALHGQSEGIVLFATELGEADRAVRDVAALGAEIQQRFDEIGYFRARLPLKQFP